VLEQTSQQKPSGLRSLAFLDHLSDKDFGDTGDDLGNGLGYLLTETLLDELGTGEKRGKREMGQFGYLAHGLFG
jgi:hypothetical protein